jgi:hypothetical protein
LDGGFDCSASGRKSVAEIRALRDHPLVAEVERLATINPAITTDSARDLYADLFAELSRSVFGVAYDDVGPDEDAGVVSGDWSAFEAAYRLAEAPDWDQVNGFRELGWDVTDDHGRPLLVLRHFSWQLLAAIRGEFGAKLPGETPISAEIWGDSLEADARRFRSGAREKR